MEITRIAALIEPRKSRRAPAYRSAPPQVSPFGLVNRLDGYASVRDCTTSGIAGPIEVPLGRLTRHYWQARLQHTRGASAAGVLYPLEFLGLDGARISRLPLSSCSCVHCRFRTCPSVRSNGTRTSPSRHCPSSQPRLFAALPECAAVPPAFRSARQLAWSWTPYGSQP